MTPTEALKRACAQNKTWKDLVARIQAYRERTGRDFDAVYIMGETNSRLPEAVQVTVFRKLSIDGVPVRLLHVLPPDHFAL